MTKMLSFDMDSLLNKGLKIVTSWKFIAAMTFLLILFILSVSYLYNAYKKNLNFENFQDKSAGDKKAEIMLFSVDWCPHCKTAKPEWEQVKTDFQGKSVNGYELIFTDVNCTEETPDVEKLINTYKIQGYPTIKLIKDGQVIEFDAKPTKSSLTQFINTAI